MNKNIGGVVIRDIALIIIVILVEHKSIICSSSVILLGRVQKPLPW
jgi:hypothetical protein